MNSPCVPIRVLLVDDQPAIRRGLKLFLTLQGRGSQLFAIEEPIGPNLIEEILRLNPDLLLLDVRFKFNDKIYSGIELTHSLRLEKPDLKIIFYSAFDFPQYKNAALQAGGDAFVSRRESLYTLFKTMMMICKTEDPHFGKIVYNPIVE